MPRRSIRLSVVVIAVLLLCGVSLFAYAQLSKINTQTLTVSQPASTSALATPSRGSITFSSPVAGSGLTPGQILTISGAVTPAPVLPDNVVIVAGQLDSTTAIPGVVLVVQPDGSFSYSIVVSPYWTTGAYVITVTDSNGATGTETFIVEPPS